MGLLDAVHSLQAGLDYHLSRQNLLTANLAHIDTPNFKPLDLARGEGNFASALHVAMEATDPAHFGASASAPTDEHFQVISDPSAAAGYDGNGVNVDREAPKADDSTDQLIERFADDDPFSADEEERRVWSRFRPTDVVRVDGDDVVVQPGELEHGLVRPFSNLRARSRAVMARAVKRASHHGSSRRRS